LGKNRIESNIRQFKKFILRTLVLGMVINDALSLIILHIPLGAILQIFHPANGSYHIRADLHGTQFWSDNVTSHCEIPGCESAQVTIPGRFKHEEVTIDYIYDSL
jgi:hypothetical protein